MRAGSMRRCAVVAVAAGGAFAVPLVAAAATGPTIKAPTRAAIGESVSVSATGLRTGGVYRLSFEPPAGSASRKTICERTLDRPYRSGGEDRTYVFRGRVPTTLRCGPRGGNSTTRTEKLKPGRYRWVVARKTGHGTWDKAYSIVVAHVTVTRSAG